ncbi:hypothetical protein OKA04_07385 [Luteolibacter flavescens]|uniref:Uncharacterized protein n=1 Tax=Luteolibacter flavescens TaxID=1859460 RepID=A0ABT3FLV0_9BACT|nr:hypothetical protein [Luteolibacter flavescens]MCW1884550.1 hypothetical protein [Luteolibacter flavescens]
MADEKAPLPKTKHKGSCLERLMALVSFVTMAGLGTAVYFMTQAQDLTDIKGRATPTASTPKVRDLRAVLKNSLDRNYPLTLGEEEINQYIRQTLVSKQGGFAGSQVSLDGVSVRLEDGRAEIITERKVFGQPVTLSMYVRIEQHIDVHGKTLTGLSRDGGSFAPNVKFLDERLKKGGRFGKLVVPQGFLLLAMPQFEKLAKVYEREIHLAFEEMSRIRMEKGKLVLDPRADGGSSMLPGESF